MSIHRLLFIVVMLVSSTFTDIGSGFAKKSKDSMPKDLDIQKETITATIPGGDRRITFDAVRIKKFHDHYEFLRPVSAVLTLYLEPPYLVDQTDAVAQLRLVYIPAKPPRSTAPATGFDIAHEYNFDHSYHYYYAFDQPPISPNVSVVPLNEWQLIKLFDSFLVQWNNLIVTVYRSARPKGLKPRLPLWTNETELKRDRYWMYAEKLLKDSFRQVLVEAVQSWAPAYKVLAESRGGTFPSMDRLASIMQGSVKLGKPTSRPTINSWIGPWQLGRSTVRGGNHIEYRSLTLRQELPPHPETGFQAIAMVEPAYLGLGDVRFQIRFFFLPPAQSNNYGDIRSSPPPSFYYSNGAGTRLQNAGRNSFISFITQKRAPWFVSKTKLEIKTYQKNPGFHFPTYTFDMRGLGQAIDALGESFFDYQKKRVTEVPGNKGRGPRTEKNQRLKESPEKEQLSKATSPSQALPEKVTPGTTTKLDGIWKGHYVCGQGATALALTIVEKDKGAISATFSFSPSPDNPDVPSGSYTMTGRFQANTRQLTLHPQDWLMHPSGFVAVGLTGILDLSSTSLRGTIESPGCQHFEVTKVDEEWDRNSLASLFPTPLKGWEAGKVAVKELPTPTSEFEEMVGGISGTGGKSSVRLRLRRTYQAGTKKIEVEIDTLNFDMAGRIQTAQKDQEARSQMAQKGFQLKQFGDHWGFLARVDTTVGMLIQVGNAGIVSLSCQYANYEQDLDRYRKGVDFPTITRFADFAHHKQ